MARLFCDLLVLIAGWYCAGGAQPSMAAENLVRNGSFEGGPLYWHNIDPKQKRIVEGGKNGRHALRIEKDYVMSAPFRAEKGEPYTVSFWVKGDKPGLISVQMPPSAREVGTASKRLWMTEGTKSAPIGTDWKRVSFTWKADLPNDGFWPRQNYLVSIGAGDTTPVLIDGVTVTQGRQGTSDYLGAKPIEATAECLDWPGFEGAKANIFEPGATVRIVGHANNCGDRPCSATLRWQFFDYEGAAPLGKPVDRAVELAAGQSESITLPMKLPARGCLLVRVSVLVDGKTIDSSELPLTSLAYPMAATKPDFRERFGGSFAGGIGCVEKFQRIGFGWIRWRPHSNGEDHLPIEPKPGQGWKWTWFDKELDEQEAHGCSAHLVLYPPPKWVMTPGNPLPKDMRWKADDPRWQDLSIQTTWDKFVKGAVEHYRGRSVIFEIENEPDFDRWLESKLADEYSRFTLRTARLIKQTAPNVKVMVNNVYGVPSSLNTNLFHSAAGLKDIDVVSWHDYHAGWLTDAKGIQRMRQALDEAGGKHVELWFNEGWAFTNTAVDEPIACTGLTSVQSTNAIMASVAEMSVAGQKKTILFHTSYEDHGQSFWDYSGPGTLLWDWYNYPLPLVATWNVMSHHIGISDEIGFVRPLGANLAIFQDLRNDRGVILTYADQDSQQDATFALPAALKGMIVEDCMGNAAPLSGPKLIVPRSGRLTYLYDARGSSAKEYLAALEPLDRKHASFVTAGDQSAAIWRLPATWEGTTKGMSEGSIALCNGKPVWKLEQVWPADPTQRENYRPMTWTGVEWNVKEGGMGGQPEATMKDGVLTLKTRAEHGEPRRPRWAGLVFVAPKGGVYSLHGKADAHIWDGANKTQLVLYRKAAKKVTKLLTQAVENDGAVGLDNVIIELDANDELVILPRIEGAFAGGELRLRDFSITEVTGHASASQIFRLPQVWEGTEKGRPTGNPLLMEKKPVWRLDQLKPKADRIFPASYEPLVWTGSNWSVREGGQGGQPGVEVADGIFKLGMRGPWNGPGIEHEKTAALVFVAPARGTYKIDASVSAKKWEGGAETFPFVVLKKDSQRAAELKKLELPSDGKPVNLSIDVELSADHEVVFLPSCPQYNSGASCEIQGLTIRRAP